MQSDRDDIREAVRAELKRQQITPTAMARDLQTNLSVITRWLNGDTTTNTRNASAIMRYLGIRITVATECGAKLP